MSEDHGASVLGASAHATCVAVGEAGVLIRGPSGSGKSRLAAELIARAEAAERFARLVADDRVFLSAVNGRLIASAPPAIAGLIERRGLGVTRTPYLESAVVRLVIDLVAQAERMPAEEELSCELKGLALPRLALKAHDPTAAELVSYRLSALVRPSGFVT